MIQWYIFSPTYNSLSATSNPDASVTTESHDTSTTTAAPIPCLGEDELMVEPEVVKDNVSTLDSLAVGPPYIKSATSCYGGVMPQVTGSAVVTTTLVADKSWSQWDEPLLPDR